MWFEAISRLRINLGKSEILPVGRAENVEILALELGCKVGALPSTWGSPWVHRTNLWWFGMGWRRGFGRGYPCGRDKIFLKELIWSTLSSMTIYFMSLMRKPRVVRLRLKQIQRDFLWVGGVLERKPHLVKWQLFVQIKGRVV